MCHGKLERRISPSLSPKSNLNKSLLRFLFLSREQSTSLCFSVLCVSVALQINRRAGFVLHLASAKSVDYPHHYMVSSLPGMNGCWFCCLCSAGGRTVRLDNAAAIRSIWSEWGCQIQGRVCSNMDRILRELQFIHPTLLLPSLKQASGGMKISPTGMRHE